jgi:hypothetical protein
MLQPNYSKLQVKTKMLQASYKLQLAKTKMLQANHELQPNCCNQAPMKLL